MLIKCWSCCSRLNNECWHAHRSSEPACTVQQVPLTLDEAGLVSGPCFESVLGLHRYIGWSSRLMHTCNRHYRALVRKPRCSPFLVSLSILFLSVLCARCLVPTLSAPVLLRRSPSPTLSLNHAVTHHLPDVISLLAARRSRRA